MEEEQRSILATNILVSTPGRLLQHMDETPNFDCNSLQILGRMIDTVKLLIVHTCGLYTTTFKVLLTLVLLQY